MRVKWGQPLVATRSGYATRKTWLRLADCLDVGAQAGVPAPRWSFNPLQPAGQPRGGDVHRETLQSKREKPQEPRGGHLKYFLALKHGKGVMPLGDGPVVPKFPQPTADPSRKKEAVEAARKTLRKIT